MEPVGDRWLAVTGDDSVVTADADGNECPGDGSRSRDLAKQTRGKGSRVEPTGHRPGQLTKLREQQGGLLVRGLLRHRGPSKIERSAYPCREESRCENHQRHLDQRQIQGLSREQCSPREAQHRGPGGQKSPYGTELQAGGSRRGNEVGRQDDGLGRGQAENESSCAGLGRGDPRTVGSRTCEGRGGRCDGREGQDRRKCLRGRCDGRDRYGAH